VRVDWCRKPPKTLWTVALSTGSERKLLLLAASLFAASAKQTLEMQNTNNIHHILVRRARTIIACTSVKSSRTGSSCMQTRLGFAPTSLAARLDSARSSLTA
jgi:hypothetical protein